MFNVVLTFFTNLLQLIPAGILLRHGALRLADKGESLREWRAASSSAAACG
jgi:hypothetical protein